MIKFYYINVVFVNGVLIGWRSGQNDTVPYLRGPRARKDPNIYFYKI